MVVPPAKKKSLDGDGAATATATTTTTATATPPAMPSAETRVKKVRHGVKWPCLQKTTCPWQRGRRPRQRQQLEPHKQGRCLHLRRSQRRRRRRLQPRETSALSAAVAPPADKQLVAAATAPSAAGVGPSAAVATGPGRGGGYGDSATSGSGRMTGESEGREGGCYWERPSTAEANKPEGRWQQHRHRTRSARALRLRGSVATAECHYLVAKSLWGLLFTTFRNFLCPS